MMFLVTFRDPNAPNRPAETLQDLEAWYGGTQRSVALAYWKGHLQYYRAEYALVEQVVDRGILAAVGQEYAAGLQMDAARKVRGDLE